MPTLGICVMQDQTDSHSFTIILPPISPTASDPKYNLKLCYGLLASKELRNDLLKLKTFTSDFSC